MQKGFKHHPCPETIFKKTAARIGLHTQNLLFLMRCSLLLMAIQLAFAGTVLCASTASAQNLSQQISLNLKDASLKEALTAIEKQSSVQFNVQSTLLRQSARKINIAASQISIKEAIIKILAGTDLRYRVVEGYVIIEPKPVPPQPGKISGRVTDEKGEYLPGVNIRIIESTGGTQTGVDGSYVIALAPATYTLEFSYISYQTQRVTGVIVTQGGATKLDISMKPAENVLKEVTVTSGFQRASAAGLYARQKNAAGITDGVSAAQIARTPDNDVGAVLKRISGLNVVDNRYVVVRGLSDRYNQAQIDGVTQPSTSMNQRNFAFDAIPAEMVSSVVVNKTATPDLSSEFAGGQVSVNTLDIPVQNFTQFQIGTGYNSNTIGKDFLQAGARSKFELLGFTNNRHQRPFGLRAWVTNDNAIVPNFVVPQSRTFDSEGFRMYQYGFEPNQNYRFSFGRTYPLKNDLRFGFVGGVSFRNTQEINDFISTRANLQFEDIDKEDVRQVGNVYKYNSTLSGLFNVGLQGKGFKLSLRNMYSHVYKNNYYTYTSADPNQPGVLTPETRIKFNLQAPEGTTVLQHKLEGEHTLSESGIKMTWNGSYTNVRQAIDDRRKFQSTGTGAVNGIAHYQRYYVQNPFTNDGNPDYRLYTDTKQKDYNWGLNLSKSFDFLKDKTQVKIGYNGFSKTRDLVNYTAEIYNNSYGTIFVGPYEYTLSPELLGTGPGKIFYNVPASSGEQFNGQSKSHSGYAMLDQRFFKKLRLVYGVRYESYNMANTQFKSKDYDVNRDDNNTFLPSANITYSLTESMNFRASYALTVIRPDFRETSIFGMYDADLNAIIQGANLKSTKVKNIDLRYEWYPAPGEIISISAFYKKFDKPIELVFLQKMSMNLYAFQNQQSAENYGMEMEIRKSFGFIADKSWLKNLSVFGNGTIIRSEVKALIYSGINRETITPSDQKRALFGQSPWIVNTGLSYTANQNGVNIVFNKSGYRTNTISNTPAGVEYELGRSLVDLQLFTRLFKQKGELKLNVSNLLNAKSTFYNNPTGYTGGGETNFVYTRQEGKTDNYNKDEGDFITYQLKTGINFSMAFTYKF